jgi:CBS domain-containing protein
MSNDDDVVRSILLRKVVRGDGRSTIGVRVFCTTREQSVTLDTCRTCPRCLEIAPDATSMSASVRCRPEVDDVVRENAESAVGVVVRGPVFAVDQAVPLPVLRSMFRASGVTAIFVVDEKDRLVGLVRDLDLRRSRLTPVRLQLPTPGDDLAALMNAPDAGQIAAEIMSPTATISEETPIRRAVLQMATSRITRAPVVTADGELVAILADIEGLRWLAQKNRAL